MAVLRSRWSWMALIAAAVALPHLAGAHHFVAVVLMPQHSPTMDMMTAAANLLTRGHQVTVVANHKELPVLLKAADRHKALEAGHAMNFVTFDSPLPSFEDILKRHLGNLNNQSRIALMSKLQHTLAWPCNALLQNSTAMELIRSLDADALLETSIPMPGTYDTCSCVLSHLLDGMPRVLVNGCALFKGPASIAQFGSGLTAADLHTWRGWALNHYHHKHMLPTGLGVRIWGDPWVELRCSVGAPAVLQLFNPASWVLLWQQSWLARLMAPLSQSGSSSGQQQHGPPGCEPLVELHFNSFMVEPPRPLKTNRVLVGPVSVRPVHTEVHSPAVAEFMQGADPEAGIIFVAFGSSSHFATVLTAEECRQLALAFADLSPSRVLWNLRALPQGVSKEDLPLGSNTQLADWVDYNDILGHPACKVFVTHAGIHSIYEAAFHGVPIIGVPFQDEQWANAVNVASRGMGEVAAEAVALRKQGRMGHGRRHTREYMAALIKKVRDAPSYRAAAKTASHALQLHYAQRTPLDRAAHEIELFLAHKGYGSNPAAAAAAVVAAAEAVAAAALALLAAGLVVPLILRTSLVTGMASVRHRALAVRITSFVWKTTQSPSATADGELDSSKDVDLQADNDASSSKGLRKRVVWLNA